MITSMGKNELYKTLLGYDKQTAAFSHKPVSQISKQNVPLNNAGFTDCDIFTYSSDFKKDNNPSSELIFDRRFDELELSDNTEKELENGASTEPYECTDVINFSSDMSIRVRLASGIHGGIPTEERIAEFYGGMAKRLDDAYSEGKFTKDEYDELNGMIADGMEWETKCAENLKAFHAVSAKMFNHSDSETEKLSMRMSIMTPEQCRAEMRSQIADYVKKFCQYDRSAILNMFNSVRYGK